MVAQLSSTRIVSKKSRAKMDRAIVVRAKIFIASLALLLSSTAPALADRDDDYADGVEAYNREVYRGE